jgi:predicted transcriptional regulator
MSFHQDLRDLHRWGRSPKEIASILGVPLQRIMKTMVNMGLIRKEAKQQAPVGHANRSNSIRQLDVQIEFHTRRAQDLAKYRNQLASIQQTGEQLHQVTKGQHP